MKQRLKWEELYEGRFVVAKPNRIFRLEKPEAIDGWLVSEEVGNGNWVIRYRLNKYHYNFWLCDNEITRELNRDFLLNKLLNETEGSIKS